MTAPRSLSPYFAGRRAETALLRDAFKTVALSRAPTLVWIGGEAGVGKTRLVQEFVKSVGDEAVCVVGTSIIQSESGLPFAPFTGALRQLVRTVGSDVVSERMGFSNTNALALLLPEFGEFPKGDPAIVRARMFESVRKLFEIASASRPLVLVLEDMHWADAGSRDLLRFLIANLSDSPVLMIATYRPESDDGAVVGSLAADQARPGRGQSIHLPRLNRKEVSDQLEGLLGYLPSGQLVAEVFKRSAGVPLLTEAMIDGAGRLRKRMPESIRGLMARTLDELPLETMQLLGAMAVGGLRVSPTVLAKVMDIASEEVGRIARPAIDARALRVDEGSLVFRHALLRDAIADQMLESDAAHWHAAYALTLGNDPVLCPMTWVSMSLALHWRCAGEPRKAISAAWTAAQEAHARYAYDEQLQMLEIVLDLWDELPDADVLLGVAHLDLLEEATDTACWAAEPIKGLRYVSHALEKLEGTAHADRVVALLLQRAILRQQHLMPGEMEDLRQAESLAVKGNALRAETLGQLSRALIGRGQLVEARSRADELSTVAAAIGSEEFALEGSLVGAHLDALTAAKVDPLLPVIENVRSAGLWRLEMIGSLARLEVLASASRHQEVVQVGLVALDRAAELGQSRYAGPAISQYVADSMILLGDWYAAQRIIDRALDVTPAPLGRVQLLQSTAWIACNRGQAATVSNIVQEVRALDATGQTQKLQVWKRLELEIGLAVLSGHLDVAAAEAAAISAYLSNESSDQALPLLCVAARALRLGCTDRGALGDLVAAANPILRSCADDAPFNHLFKAETCLRSSDNALKLWQQSTEAFATAGYPFHEAYCAYRVGLTIAECGKRAGASDSIKRAADLAMSLGCEPLLNDIILLAQRTRVKLSACHQVVPNELHELTDRELQILRLVASGKRNRDIAQELYISPKTASVHVSNILSKLNVKTRGAAAAVAHRLQLFETP